MKQTFTVASYNIRHGADVGYDWARLASHILSVDADIVGLQEVDMYTKRTGGRDSLAGLSDATGFFHALFIPAMGFDGGQYGTAILSRYAIIKSEVIPFDSNGYEPRACGHVVVDMKGKPVHIYNTHLSYEADALRREQFAALVTLIAARMPADAPYILMGDFNTERISEFAPLIEHGALCANANERVQKTFRYPPEAIDNIVYDAARLTLTDVGMVDSADSDHNLLWAGFEIKGK